MFKQNANFFLNKNKRSSERIGSPFGTFMTFLMMAMCLGYFIYLYGEMIDTHSDLYESQRINNREYK